METAVIILFRLAFMLYGAAAVLYIYYYVSKRNLMGKIATGLTALGALAHAASVITRIYVAGYIPLDSPFEAYLLSTLFIVLIYLIVEQLFDIQALGVIVMPLVAVLMGLASSLYGAPTALSDLVSDSWIVMHVAVVFLAFGGFIVAAAVSVLYLMQESQLKSKKVIVLFRRMPSLESLDELSATAIAFALPFWTMGMVTGIIRAVQWQQENWVLNPVVVVTVVAWVIYAFYMVAKWLMGWRGRRMAVTAIVGFLAIVVIRFMSANYLGFWQQLTR